MRSETSIFCNKTSMCNLSKWIETTLVLFITIFTSEIQCIQSFVKEPSAITVNYGEPVILPCLVSDLKGVLQWTKDGFGLGTDRNLVGFDRYHMTGTNEAGNYSLYIRLALVVDDAEYQCQVSGADGEPSLRSKKARLTVLLGPKDDKVYIDKPSPVETTAGSPIRLTCMAGLAKPAAKIKWFKGSSPIKRGVKSSTRSLENSSLQSVRGWVDMTPDKNYHDANISCEVSHKALSSPIIRSVIMVVKYPPSVSISVDSMRVKENDDVRFTCKAEGNPPDLTYRWEVNGVWVIGDHTTHFLMEKVKRDKNKAKVSCKVTNAIGSGSSKHTLSVEYAPAFKKDPEDVDADENRGVVLNCNVDGNPPPEIIWTHEDANKVIKIGARLNLKVSKDTIGTYHCRTAAIGYPELSRSMKVYMRGAPKIVPDQQNFGLEGDTVQVNCLVRSVPKPSEVVWTRYGVTIDPAESRYSILEQNKSGGIQNTLVISDATLDDFGSYNCTAKNGYGSNTGTIILNRQQSLPLVTTLVAIIGGIIFLALVVVVIVLFKKKGKGYKDSSMEKHSMQSSDRSSTHDSVLKVETRTATGSDLTPSDDDEEYSAQEDWEGARDHLQQNVFRYSGDFVDPVFPPKELQSSYLPFQEGANNNSAGYIPYVDYSREYNPPPPPPPINYNRNSIYSAAPTLNNVDPRYSATYGNPYLRMPPNSRGNQNTGVSSGMAAGPAQPPIANLNNAVGNNKNATYGQNSNNRPNNRNSNNVNNQYIMVPQSDNKFGVQGTHI